MKRRTHILSGNRHIRGRKGRSLNLLVSRGLSTVRVSVLIIIYIVVQVFADPDDLRLNQLGFCVNGPKTAIVISPETWFFSLRSLNGAERYFTGDLSPATKWNSSGESLKVADFSSFTQSGTYTLYVEGIGTSYPFQISDNTFHEITRGLLRAFYYQRASTVLTASCAGAWARAGGHEDRDVIVHPSAASDPSKPGARVSGQRFPSPKGWYDAGDYGKYVVNAGITTYQLLLLYDLYPNYFDSFSLTIPESDNTLPDILDEIKWELDWLLTMQDPADGGVYHKLTGKTFIGDLVPSAAHETRYFIGKGSAATFDFTAVMAMASRIYRNFIPSFADSCLYAAKFAWEWGGTYPDSTFENPPDVMTGEYADGTTRDEYMWAANELFIATGDSSYYFIGKDKTKNAGVPSWPDVAMLGFYSLALFKDDSLAKSNIIQTANMLLRRTRQAPYHTTISGTEFYWGSNGVVANQGMVLLLAFLLTKDVSYLDGAIHAADYLFGRNATGYCFVTGYGHKSPMHPHHRPSTADNIKAPVPGLLVGGPNAGSRAGENCEQEYPSKSAKAYLDNNCSFTTNEVAINWNAPAAFLAGGIDAILNSGIFDLRGFGSIPIDTLPPVKPLLTVTDIGADNATLTWSGTEAASVTVAYGYTQDTRITRRCHTTSPDSGGSLKLTGLQPDTRYYLTVWLVDHAGNCSETADSFSTSACTWYTPGLYTDDKELYQPGTSPQITLDLPEGVSAQLIYATGGSSVTDTVPCSNPSGTATFNLPATAAGNDGIVYSLLLTNGNDTLRSPVRSLIPDSITLEVDSFAVGYLHRMVSIPGLYRTRPSNEVFENLFGDTVQWRFFGYNPSLQNYLPFDSLKSGKGGWLYHERTNGFTTTVNAVPPDSLFPIQLQEGWNCIGSPYTFPIYWENSMIDLDGALLQLSDSAAGYFVRRQFFHYIDTLADRRNNGRYITNRHVASHRYNDSAVITPWKAYWIYAEKQTVTVLLNPSPIRVPPQQLAKHIDSGTRDWAVSFTIQTGNIVDGPFAFGCSELAKDGYDRFDTPSPPPLSTELQGAFMHPEWTTRAKAFIEDFSCFPYSQSYQWNFDVSTQLTDAPLSFMWNIDGAVNGNLYLYDDVTKSAIDMQRQNVVRFPVSSGQRTIAFIWSQKIIQTTSHPATLNLSVQCGKHYRLSYEIPYTHTFNQIVRIDIFDIQGRKIVTPVYGNIEPGYHSIWWDGCTAQATDIAEGYYIARISVGTNAKSCGFQVLR